MPVLDHSGEFFSNLAHPPLNLFSMSMTHHPFPGLAVDSSSWSLGISAESSLLEEMIAEGLSDE